MLDDDLTERLINYATPSSSTTNKPPRIVIIHYCCTTYNAFIVVVRVCECVSGVRGGKKLVRSDIIIRDT